MQSKIQKLDEYLKATDGKDLFHIESDLISWIDWREHDDAIVEYIESSLQTGALSAHIQDRPADDLELIVQFEGTTFNRMIVDRDDTIKWLNDILQPKYEIRFCKHSEASDTLAFISLSTENWLLLTEQYGKERIDELFEIITPDATFFNKEHKFED